MDINSHTDKSIDIELAELKSTLLEINARIEQVESSTDSLRRFPELSGKRTTQQQLASRYRCFAIVAFICAFIFPPALYASIPTSTTTLRIIGAAWFMLFMLTAALMDMSLMLWVEDVDIQRQSVGEVITRFRTLRSRHLIYQAILIPMAVVALALLAYINIQNTTILIAMGIGGAIGAMIGVFQWLRFMRGYRDLTRE